MGTQQVRTHQLIRVSGDQANISHHEAMLGFPVADLDPLNGFLPCFDLLEVGDQIEAVQFAWFNNNPRGRIVEMAVIRVVAKVPRLPGQEAAIYVHQVGETYVLPTPEQIRDAALPALELHIIRENNSFLVRDSGLNVHEQLPTREDAEAWIKQQPGGKLVDPPADNVARGTGKATRVKTAA